MEVSRTLSRRRRTSRAAVAALLVLLLPAASARGDEAAQAPKILRVATSGDYAPFSFAAPGTPTDANIGSDGKPLTGFDIEIATRFARDNGYQLEFVRFRWPEFGHMLAVGGFDVAMSGVTLKPERSVAGRYSIPVAVTHAVALTWPGSGATTVEDLDRQSRRIAVNAGGHLESVAREMFRRAAIVAIADNEAVRMAMLDRAFDAVVTDNFEDAIWTAGIRDVVRIEPLTDDRKAYLLPADRGPLAAELDRWLMAREKDGTLAGLRSQFFGDAAAASPRDAEIAATATPMSALLAAIGERLALMPLVYEAKRASGKPIEDKEQEAAVVEAAMRALGDAAAAAKRPAPDAAAARKLFETLIAIGKDAQQRLADLSDKRRPGTVRQRSQSGSNNNAAVAAEPEHTPAPFPAKRVFDLGNELRPALGRITEKIARILVALDEPVSVVQARRRIGDALLSRGVKPDRIDALSEAVVAISVHKAGS